MRVRIEKMMQKAYVGIVCENVDCCGIVWSYGLENGEKYGKTLTESYKKTTMELIIS